MKRLATVLALALLLSQAQPAAAFVCNPPLGPGGQAYAYISAGSGHQYDGIDAGVYQPLNAIKATDDNSTYAQVYLAAAAGYQDVATLRVLYSAATGRIRGWRATFKDFAGVVKLDTTVLTTSVTNLRITSGGNSIYRNYFFFVNGHTQPDAQWGQDRLHDPIRAFLLGSVDNGFNGTGQFMGTLNSSFSFGDIEYRRDGVWINWPGPATLVSTNSHDWLSSNPNIVSMWDSRC